MLVETEHAVDLWCYDQKVYCNRFLNIESIIIFINFFIHPCSTNIIAHHIESVLIHGNIKWSFHSLSKQLPTFDVSWTHNMRRLIWMRLHGLHCRAVLLVLLALNLMFILIHFPSRTFSVASTLQFTPHVIMSTEWQLISSWWIN
jgi:hypothetical protein